MSSTPEHLLKTHEALVHSERQKVVSHVQRKSGEWIINTVMIEGCDAPFKFKRKQKYKDLNGQKVNLTYYPDVEVVAGFELEIMSVVRIRVT
ncbi:MAG: hypothetical protein OQK25_03055 [Gammaproteobacteria bacterium]|nr:hypothetical protein [Gammaproteobacteria bacterium]